MDSIKRKMPKIQLELDEDEDMIVELYKIKYKLKDKREAVKKMIKCFKIDLNIKLAIKK